jgi:hypothetical protein
MIFFCSDESDPVRKTFDTAFTQALAGLGWSDGRNVRVDLRWTGAWHEHADAPYALALLRPRRERPCRRTAEPHNELPPSHQRSPTAGSTPYRSRGCMSGPDALSFLHRGRPVLWPVGLATAASLGGRLLGSTRHRGDVGRPSRSAPRLAGVRNRSKFRRHGLKARRLKVTHCGRRRFNSFALRDSSSAMASSVERAPPGFKI